MFKKEQGFTLIEILVVVVILGILIAVLVPRLGGFTKSSEINATDTDLRVMKNGVQQHYIDNRDQDLTIVELNQYLDFQVKKTSAPGVVPEVYETITKQDPWKQPYYIYVSNASRFVSFYSLGPDGKKATNPANTEDDIFIIFYPKY